MSFGLNTLGADVQWSAFVRKALYISIPFFNKMEQSHSHHTHTTHTTNTSQRTVHNHGQYPHIHQYPHTHQNPASHTHPSQPRYVRTHPNAHTNVNAQRPAHLVHTEHRVANANGPMYYLKIAAILWLIGFIMILVVIYFEYYDPYTTVVSSSRTMMLTFLKVGSFLFTLAGLVFGVMALIRLFSRPKHVEHRHVRAYY